MLQHQEKEKLHQLEHIVRSLESVIVAYSGGVDSAVVAQIAHQTLGTQKSLIVTADSPSMAPYELQDAIALAEKQGWNHRIINTQEMNDPRYTDNSPVRCFFCKTELYTQLQHIARTERFNAIANGANADDMGDYRPGMKAARDFTVHSPLLEAGIRKNQVRKIAQIHGLPNWDKPAQPCLSSRIPYGSKVTANALSMISEAERHLRKMGFTQCRVRHYGQTARVEIPKEEIPRYLEPDVKASAEQGILAVGYHAVELETDGFKSGRLNETLTIPSANR